jgi:Fic family protein
MSWNWQKEQWPNFTYEPAALEPLEARFLLHSGEFIGAFRHVNPDERDTIRIELIGDEALKTAAIEGEVLDRESLQSSLRLQFGVATDRRRVSPEERGMAEMMVDLYRTFSEPLAHETLFAWHEMVMAGRRIEMIGSYRRHGDAMQIVSGAYGHERVHFEAPPSTRIEDEMESFINWFNETAPGGKAPLPPLARAGIAHLYFESIHPFEDGNGRVGRALAEKSLAQNLGQPTLIALAYTIERSRKAYYAMLEESSRELAVTHWLTWFGQTVLNAQRTTLERVEFHIAKTRFHDRLRGQLNERQEKAIARMFREGRESFKGGLSAENYISITGASRATATRDLQDLVAKGALNRTGVRRHTRYYLILDLRPAPYQSET